MKLAPNRDKFMEVIRLLVELLTTMQILRNFAGPFLKENHDFVVWLLVPETQIQCLVTFHPL
jgi:hypothetical protein